MALGIFSDLSSEANRWGKDMSGYEGPQQSHCKEEP